MKKQFQIFLFSNQTLGQTVLKNTFWLGISQIASRIIRAVIVIYAARILGAAGYGVFSYAIALAGFMSIFSNIGIDWILTREAAKNPELKSQYLSTVLFIKLILLTFLFILITFVAPYFTTIPEAKNLLPIIAVLFLADGLRKYGFAFIRSLEKMETEAGINIFTNIITVILSLIILLYNPTPYSLAIGYTIGSILGLVMTVFVIRTYLNKLLSNFTRKLIKPILTSVWPFAIINFLGASLFYTSILILGWIRTAPELGFYSAAQKPIQLLTVLSIIIATSTLPALSRWAVKETNKFKLLLEQSLSMVMLLAIPLTIGGIILGDQVIILLYGTDYTSAAIIFRLLALSFLATFPFIIINNAIFASDTQKKFIPYMTLGAIFNIVLNIYLISKLGAPGAAIATVISQFVTYGWVYCVLRTQVGLVVAPSIYKIVIAGVIMGMATWGLKQLDINLLLTIAVATVMYFTLLWILKEPLLEKLRSIVTRIN